MTKLRGSLVSLAFVALFGCGPGAPAAPRPGGPAPQPGAPKTLTIGQQTPREGFAPWFIAGPPGPLQWEELHSNFLVTADGAGNFESWLAARLPSLSDGSVEILSDGGLRTTWKIHPNVKWHDGRPFTTEDVVFGWQVGIHPDIPVSRSPTLRAVATMETPDPQTLVITYSSTFYLFLSLGFRDLYPLPKHLLEEAFQGPKDSFINLPFWSSGYIHNGPFRVKEFVPGEQVTLERFDDYFLGRPKVDRIIIRFIADNNAIVAGLLSSSVDITGDLPTDMVVRLAEQWRQTGGGWVRSRQAFWRFVAVQFLPEWGGPPELQQDVRVRRGLTHLIDRDALRTTIYPGFTDTEGDTFMVAGDARSPIVGKPFARFPYDPGAAAREFAGAGWRRAGDGQMLNTAGEQVRINLRAPTSDVETDLAVIARNWRELGIDVVEEVTPPPLRRDNEFNVKFPGLEITSQGSGDRIFRRFDSRLRPTAQNRFAGSNSGNYVNPAMDRLIDQFSSTLDENRGALLLREKGDLLATDLPVLPLYFHVRTVVGLQHVAGVDDVHGAAGSIGTVGKTGHLWDRQ